MKTSTALKMNAKNRTAEQGNLIALKATDFETKILYTDYVYEIEKLQDKVFNYQLSCTKANRTKYIGQIKHILYECYKLTDEEVKPIMDYFKKTADLSAITVNSTKTAETRELLKAANETITAIAARKLSETYTLADRNRDLKAARARKANVRIRYTEQLQKQGGLTAFRKLFENKCGYILNNESELLTQAFETANERKERKRQEEITKFTKRAADCNALGATIDAAQLLKDGGIKALKDAVKTFYEDYTRREVERAKANAALAQETETAADIMAA